MRARRQGLGRAEERIIAATVTSRRELTAIAPPPTPQGSRFTRWISSVPGSTSGLVKALRAASADLSGAIDTQHHPAVDPLELRDPEYIRAGRFLGRRVSCPNSTSAPRSAYRRPPRRPGAACCNDPGGWLIADTFVFGQYFDDHFGPECEFFQLTHDLVFKLPVSAG